jgi:hypothetical protein
MTQTLLSAATTASQGYLRLARRTQWHRHSCLCAFADARIRRMADPAASLVREIPGPRWRLIANLELEFHLTQRKLSPLRIPNRKFLTIFQLLAHPLPLAQPHPRKPFFTNHQSRAICHQFLIHGSAIKTQRNRFKNNSLRISNRRQNRPRKTPTARWRNADNLLCLRRADCASLSA